MSDATHGSNQETEPDADAAPGQPTGARGPSAEDRDSTRSSEDRPGVLRTVARGFVALLILGLGGYAAFWFNWTEGRAQTGAEEPESARLVETVTVQRETTNVMLRAMGTVEPAREVVMRPRVSGKIVRQNEAFVPGGHFEADEFMLQIDRADYQHTLSQRRSELEQAKATLEIEKGDQAVAREELKLLEGQIQNADRDLILRKPQVNQAKAAVKSAEAAIEEAQLDLERTRIEAPFDGHLVSRSVTVGNNVSQGDQLATYVGSDRYWVRVSIPVSHLRWIEASERAERKGSPVRITNETAWGPDAYREGHVARVIGRLEEQSRRAQVMVSVDDPLAREPEHEDKPALIIDSFVDARIRGQEIEDTVAMDRSYLRGDGVVWVMNGSDRLESRSVSVAFRGEERAYVEDGLQDRDRVVTTNLASPVDGMLLRTADASDDPAGPQATEGEETDDE